MNIPEQSPAEIPEQRPRRVWLIVLAGVLIVALLAAAWILVERHRAKSALARFEKELLAKGEKLTFAELVAPMPEGENGASEFVRLAKALQDGSTLTLNSPPAMRLVAPGKAMNIWRQQNWISQRETFAWKDVQADLDKNKDTLVQLRQVLRSAVLRSTINYRGHETLLPHLASSKSAAQWLSASSLYNLHIGDLNVAIDDIESACMIIRLSADEPILISQLVRIAIATIALHHCWPVLHSENVTDEHLARLQRIIGDIDLVTPMPQAFRGERIMARETVQMLRRATDADFEKFIDTNSSSIPDDDEEIRVIDKIPYNDEIRGAIRVAIIVPMWRFVWSYQDERHLMEEVQALITTTSEAKAQRSASAISLVAKRIKDRRGQSWSYLATDLFVGAVASGPLRAFRFQTHNELTVTAIALKRYHLRHKKYPQNLDQLVPEFLPRHPVDWMDGQKLRYRPEGDSFVLWSVGDNGKDDGGTPNKAESLNFFIGPDIVWPQPASEAEVDAYKAKTPSNR